MLNDFTHIIKKVFQAVLPYWPRLKSMTLTMYVKLFLNRVQGSAYSRGKTPHLNFAHSLNNKLAAESETEFPSFPGCYKL